MSVSLTLINKSTKECKVERVVQAFTQAVNANYTKSEKEGYVTKRGRSCLSVLFQANGFTPKKYPDTIIQTIGAQEHNLVLIKNIINFENPNNFNKVLGDVVSPFAVFELTSMISEVEKRPPWILSGKQLVFPVGMIGHYFTSTPDSPYDNNSRGLKFAKQFPGADQSEIATAYFDQFVNKKDTRKLVDPKVTSLIHFTTMVFAQNKKFRFTFMQNQMKKARYFFEPDILFCSNEIIARSVRHALYPNKNIPLKGNLRFYETTI